MSLADLKLADVKSTLPVEAQHWIASMKRKEREATERIVNDVGADYFIEYWRFYRDQLEYVRSLGGL